MCDVIHSTRVFMEREILPQEQIEQLSFEKETERFRSELSMVDKLLASKALSINYAKRLLQGPFSDVLTHIGQLAMLQRIVGNPLDWEDFSSSDIRTEN